MNRKRQLAAVTLSALLLASAAHGAENSRPWTFWYWMYGAVLKTGIHADLCAMKNVGLGGTYLMPIRGVKERPEFGGQAAQLSPKFWEMVDYSFQQADSLGLDMGIHICDGFALAGSPAIRPEESMQKVVWSDTIVQGGKVLGLTLAQPETRENYYRDIAAYAVRYAETPQRFVPVKTEWSDGISTKKGYYLASKPSTITYTFDSPVMVRSMEVMPNGNNIQAQRLLVQVSDDGVHFRDIKQLVPPRQGWQNTQCGYSFSLPTTTAKYFRFAWTPEGTPPGAEDMDAAKWKPVLKLQSVVLSNIPVINQYEGKSAAVWRIDADDAAGSEPIKMDDVVRLQLQDGKVTGVLINGKQQKKLPKGTWRILRMGHTSTGQTNATAGDGKGLEIDKFSPAAVQKLFDSWYGLFLKRPHAEVVKYLHIDSWECGSQNWGERFAEEFQARRGYDLLTYLPVMAGVAMESDEKSEQVLKDIRLTVNDLVNEKFFGTFTRLAHKHGKMVSHESNAPTFPADGLAHYRFADHPMGEYWLNSPTHDKPADMLDAVSGAHIYGKNIVQAEGFTEVRGVWNETPAMVKPLLDRNLALGMNKLFFHVTAHNPWTDRRPGMTLDGIGLFFQRDNTWYPEARGFVDYIAKCQERLQKGRPVVDIAVFTGEEIPSRSLTPDRLVEMLPGVFGEERVASERKRVANEGVPLEESPVGVTHAAHILDLKDWCNALHGYKYDSMNKEALLSMAQVRDGRIVMVQDGKVMQHSPQYRILVVPQKDLSAEVRNKIDELRKAGVVVIDSPYGERDFSQYNLRPDVVLPEGMDYAHRLEEHDGQQQHIYFVTNQQNTERTVSLHFRDRKDSVDVHFPAYGSALVSFVKSGDVKDGDMKDDDAQDDDVKVDNFTCPVSGKGELKLDGKWTVHFEETGRDTTLCLPFDWSKSNEQSMKYYSGHVTFRSSFQWKNTGKATDSDKRGNTIASGKSRNIIASAKSGNPTAVDYVKVRIEGLADIADVLVNGKHYGYAWTEPYEVCVPRSALMNGMNTIEIVVANTWHNALQGLDEGKAPYPGIWTNAKYRTKSKKLLPAGILGNVRILF